MKMTAHQIQLNALFAIEGFYEGIAQDMVHSFKCDNDSQDMEDAFQYGQIRKNFDNIIESIDQEKMEFIKNYIRTQEAIMTYNLIQEIRKSLQIDSTEILSGELDEDGVFEYITCEEGC
jgi:hypothetical protein